MILNPEDTLILIIDIQEKLINATYNKETILKNSVILSKTASLLEMPVIVSEQYPKGLGCTIDEIKSNLDDKVKYFEKTAFNALEEPELIATLKAINKKNIIVMGIETHICVHQTVCNLLELGYKVTLVSDASGSRAEKEHLSTIECIKNNGANIKTTEMILFELIKSAKHPKFKEIQGYIK